jgi:hypothetical protein
MTTVHISNGKKINDAVADKKQRAEPDPLIIADFDTAKTIAEKLIPKHHSEIASANIVYLCRNKSQKQGGIPVPGTVKKASPLERHLGGHYFDGEDDEPDFIMTVALDVWNELQPTQRTALVDHLLTRCTGEEDEKSGEMKYSIRPPQVQEFAEVAERNGRWNDGLAELGDCLKGK